jgi:hypothetical protein
MLCTVIGAASRCRRSASRESVSAAFPPLSSQSALLGTRSEKPRDSPMACSLRGLPERRDTVDIDRLEAINARAQLNNTPPHNNLVSDTLPRWTTDSVRDASSCLLRC